MLIFGFFVQTAFDKILPDEVAEGGGQTEGNQEPQDPYGAGTGHKIMGDECIEDGADESEKVHGSTVKFIF